MSKVTELLDAVMNEKPHENMAPMLQAAAEKRLENRKKEVSDSLVLLFEQCELYISGAVNSLRALRAEEKKAKESLLAMNRAFQYFAESSNPLPFCKAAGMRHGDFCRVLGLNTYELKDEDYKVPADWQPKS